MGPNFGPKFPRSRALSAEAAFLRHCRTNFENDAAKTVPAGHLAHIDFRPVAGLWVHKLWKIPMRKITLFFTGIPVVVTTVLIGVLDFWIVLVFQFSDNLYWLSLWKRVPVNSRHSDRPMKTFWHAQQGILDVGQQETGIHKTTSEFLHLSLWKRNA